MVFVNISSNRILYPEVVDLVKEVFLAILIQAMRSTGESRMTDQYRTVINGLLQKNQPTDTFEQDLKVAQVCRVENEEQPTVCFQGPQGDRRTSPLRPCQRLKHALAFRFCPHPRCRAIHRYIPIWQNSLTFSSEDSKSGHLVGWPLCVFCLGEGGFNLMPRYFPGRLQVP